MPVIINTGLNKDLISTTETQRHRERQKNDAGFNRNLFISKPKEDRDICTLCSFCIDACPTQAIKKGERGLDFNYDGCIRCFCCSEVCPEGAMKVRHGLLHILAV